MTFLKDEDRPPIAEGELDPRTKKRRRYYRIDMDLIMIVEARTLRFQACWPQGSGQVRASGKVSMAAGFAPGTA